MKISMQINVYIGIFFLLASHFAFLLDKKESQPSEFPYELLESANLCMSDTRLKDGDNICPIYGELYKCHCHEVKPRTMVIAIILLDRTLIAILSQAYDNSYFYYEIIKSKYFFSVKTSNLNCIFKPPKSQILTVI